MSARKYDSFKDLRKGKYDWKVAGRVMNLWRGYTRTKEPFKNFNLLLVDGKRARIHGFVAGKDADQLEPILEIGRVYLFENFTVKEYRPEDIFRPLRKDIQIVLDSQTKITALEEKMVNIEKYIFDLFDLADLDSQASQNRYLTDVIGVMEKPKPLARIPNKHGAIQQHITFKITDESNTIKVTFWDDFAKYFDDVLKQEIDYPIIIIIGCARVNKWSVL
ncbi:replication protein A 70 kDa DNA-binding subunit E-like [Apium graveolens]|uniref:replication protein A 70 kDa DNA-binding subunit E-like n=1 Tax=Apium graveolens TaxID=4045 RepID=UPI003D796B1B